MTVPNALIVGVNKAGTTAVFSALARHKAVCASSTKETTFRPAQVRLKWRCRPSTSTRHFSIVARASTSCSRRLRATSMADASWRNPSERRRRTARLWSVLREPSGRAFSDRYCRARLMLPQDLDFSSYIDRCIELGLTPERVEI